jgi:MerR family transcriptional regulator, thiopeptide resistance regulator
MSYSVGQVATIAGVTVRTLHHYDQIGLLAPGGRSRTGYRRYAEPDLQRLQEIMFYRELGFALEEIAALVNDPDIDPAEHLRRQHRLLTERLGRVRRMVEAVEKALEAHTMGISLSPEERFEVFGEHDPERYEDEVKQRWGETDAYKESQRRVKSYSKEDWLAIKAEAAEITQAYADAMTAGVAADSPAAMDLAERHRQHIGRWFYDCPPEMHRGLGEMYVADERFAANYEPLATGLTAWIRDAIAANAARQAA